MTTVHIAINKFSYWVDGVYIDKHEAEIQAKNINNEFNERPNSGVHKKKEIVVSKKLEFFVQPGQIIYVVMNKIQYLDEEEFFINPGERLYFYATHDGAELAKKYILNWKDQEHIKPTIHYYDGAIRISKVKVKKHYLPKNPITGKTIYIFFDKEDESLISVFLDESIVEYEQKRLSEDYEENEEGEEIELITKSTNIMMKQGQIIYVVIDTINEDFYSDIFNQFYIYETLNEAILGRKNIIQMAIHTNSQFTIEEIDKGIKIYKTRIGSNYAFKIPISPSLISSPPLISLPSSSLSSIPPPLKLQTLQLINSPPPLKLQTLQSINTPPSLYVIPKISSSSLNINPRTVQIGINSKLTKTNQEYTIKLLKTIAAQLRLPTSGTKKELVQRIMQFLQDL